MEIQQTIIPDCVTITPDVYGDERGFFQEIYQQDRYQKMGLLPQFVQDNYSRSRQHTLRGLHYQLEHSQGKLVQVMSGEVFDVAVDLRRSSPAFGKWMGVKLSGENHEQFYVPPGCAHGFLVLSETADFLYKCTDLYHPEAERTLQWDDPELGIEWPLAGEPILSPKDREGMPLADCETYS